jgi:hypothetical protein
VGGDYVIGRATMTADGGIVPVRTGEVVATGKRKIVDLDLEGMETAIATTMQMADALQAKTVELAEQARQLRATAHEGALMLNDARNHILPNGRTAIPQNPTPLEAAVCRGELDLGTVKGAERLLEALQGVERDNLESLVTWHDGNKPDRTVRRRDSMPEYLRRAENLRRGIAVSGSFFQPKHDDHPKGGETLRLRIKSEPYLPPYWFNMSTIVLLARIGARAIMAVTTPSDYESDIG